MAPLPPLRDGGCALPICPFGRACLPLISDAPDCKCSPGRLRFWVVWASRPGAAAPISIHAPRAGRDHNRRRARGAVAVISIHAPRVGRDLCAVLRCVAAAVISIHAPRVGRDRCWSARTSRPRHFNPRAPCGARQLKRDLIHVAKRFQSTRPVWGATGNGSSTSP